MMTRKDYVAVAEILSSYKDLIGDVFTFEDLVEDFSAMFAEDNSNFKHEVFREACLKNNF
jgi:hypothetical protein